MRIGQTVVLSLLLVVATACATKPRIRFTVRGATDGDFDWRTKRPSDLIEELKKHREANAYWCERPPGTAVS